MKKLLPPLLGILLIGAAFYFLLKGNQQEGMHAAIPDITISASELLADFYQDESAANQKYLNKTIEINGEVMLMGDGGNGMPVLGFITQNTSQGVRCTFDPNSKHSRKEFHLGEEVVLKCICTDYFINVKLTNCVEK